MATYDELLIGLPVEIIKPLKGVRKGAIGVITGRSQFREVLMVTVDGKRLAFLPDEVKLIIKTREG